MIFFGRDRELALLDQALAAVRRHGQLVVLSGRRGAGKTALVQHWLASRRKRAFVWTAQPDTTELDQATSFTRALQNDWGLAGGAVRPFALDAWREAFFQVAAAAETQRRIVVIDQASELLAEGSLSSSALQQAWDQRLQHRPVMFILNAHHASRVHEHLRSYTRAPLYGRLTGFWQGRPIAWLDFAKAFHRWPLPGLWPFTLTKEQSKLRAILLRQEGNAHAYSARRV